MLVSGCGLITIIERSKSLLVGARGVAFVVLALAPHQPLLSVSDLMKFLVCQVMSSDDPHHLYRNIVDPH